MSLFLAYRAEQFWHSIVDHNKHHRQLEPICLDDLALRLWRNELFELKLAWRESDFVYSNRGAAVLEKALKHNKSVTAVSIGWRLHNHKNVLIRILQAIGRYCQLTSLRLVLDDWIPEQVLKDLLLQQSDLKVIDIRAVQVLRSSNNNKNTTCGRLRRLEEGCLDHNNIVSRVMIQLHHHDHLKCLHLVDCNITDATAGMLADFLHIRGGIAELSLRQNRTLRGQGLNVICQAPVMKSLDLSLCDIDERGALAVAYGISKRPWPLQQLLLCGNYRMDATGILALTSPSCCNKLVALNMSFCDIGDHRSTLVFEALQELKECTLERVLLQGAMVVGSNALNALCSLIRQNTSLRVLQLTNPEAPRYLNPQQLHQILESLQHNYELETLDLDYNRQRDGSELMSSILREMDFQLRLNQAGRRILLSTTTTSTSSNKEDWFDVLSKAGTDMNILYWIVRQSAERFGRRQEELENSQKSR